MTAAVSSTGSDQKQGSIFDFSSFWSEIALQNGFDHLNVYFYLQFLIYVDYSVKRIEKRQKFE